MKKRRNDPDLDLDFDEIERRYIEQLPVIAAMMIPEDGKYNSKEVAADALDLIHGCLEALEESVEDE